MTLPEHAKNKPVFPILNLWSASYLGTVQVKGERWDVYLTCQGRAILFRYGRKPIDYYAGPLEHFPLETFTSSNDNRLSGGVTAAQVNAAFAAALQLMAGTRPNPDHFVCPDCVKLHNLRPTRLRQLPPGDWPPTVKASCAQHQRQTSAAQPARSAMAGEARP